ncbi:MAG: TonB-dependent siderophore receptor [Ketobacteraceae bacterium]|nr:TonB-dependent siderophore receptor [Ketobacteraceae bacterium]
MADDRVLAPVSVTAAGLPEVTENSESYAAPVATTATGMKLSPRETPQAVTTVTRTEMEDFGRNTVNDVLLNTTGVTVERVETDRTYYTARGFPITNFQVDGQGIPFTYGNVIGDLDTVIYDRIEVLRGANGLMSGTGSPSATINFVRKRPTQDLQVRMDASVGSWNTRRLDVDVSNSLTDSGSLRGRAVVSGESGESYLDRYEKEKFIGYGILEMDLSDHTRLAFGVTRQENNTDSPLWGALPLYYSDGTPTNYDASTSTSADWAYWDGTYTNAFAELSQALGNGWEAVLSVNHRETTSDARLFYVYGTPNKTGADSGLRAYPSLYELDNDQIIADLRATGPYQLFGREHQAIAGVAYWESELTDESNYGQGIGTPIVPLEDWTGDYPMPAFDAGVNGSQWQDRQKSAFAATRISVTDPFGIVAGVRLISLDSSGTSYGTTKDTAYSDELISFLGATWALTETLSVYASRGEIFDPQTETDIDGNRLAPVEGETRELGLKGAFFAGHLQSTLAYFETEQSNVAEAAGLIPGTTTTYYREVDGVESRGIEMDIQGEVSPGLEVSAGITRLDIENADGEETLTYIPEKTARVSLAWRPPVMKQVKVGASINWQDDIKREQVTGSVYTEQDSYAIVNLMAQYEFTDNLNATLNINNVTDEKYLTSLYWAQGYYGAPRNATLKLSWQY